MSTEATLAEVTQALGSSRYDDAAAALQDNAAELQLSDSAAEQATRLAERCRRLAIDRERLVQVLNDLESDEHTTRDELLALLGTTAEPPHATSPADVIIDTNPPPRSDRAETSRLSLWLLGSFRLAIDGQLVIGGDDDRSTPVLRFLACTDSAGVHKEQLADRFWPEATTRVARRNLHQAIYTIRRTLSRHGAETELVFANDHYRLGSSSVWRDTDELARCVETGRRRRSDGQDDLAQAAFEQADRLYVGELLADHPYDEWAYTIREQNRILHREAAAGMLDHHITASDNLSIIRLANRLLQLDPGDEDACRRLMSAHLALGQSHLAAMAFATQAEHLRDNHGLEPSPETIELARPLRTGCHLR